MNGTIIGVDPAALAELFDAFGVEHDPFVVQYAQQSNPLHAGIYGRELVCIMGLIAPTFLSSSAYVWLQVYPPVRHHKLAFARAAKRWVTTQLQAHPILRGHCDNSDSIRWLASLGATFTPALESLVQFEIKS